MAYSAQFLEELTGAQDLFVWESDSWETNPRPAQWYWWMGLAAAVLLVYSLWTANFLFAFLILLAVIILVIAGNEAPRKVLVQIGANGLVYDGRLYLFEDLAQFSLLYQPPELKILYIEPKGILRPRLRINLDAQDPVALRDHLRVYVKEDLNLRDEHLSDTLSRFLRI